MCACVLLCIDANIQKYQSMYCKDTAAEAGD